ncbi:hypothetical protein [Arthrobacter sp. RT-1]|uniref:hypothetical protein n=1 Tax=Arthrobacter sp. RT-1 TaxID=2292263 RepID=UPI0015F1A302|nr:hypothetical protein [Arthrobacter sp. RT-1]
MADRPYSRRCRNIGNDSRTRSTVQPGEQVGADDGADHRDHHVGHRVQLLPGPAPFVNFGVFTTFMLVNESVVFHYVR